MLDLHELSFIDSTGLRVILASRQLCERQGCDFSLSRAQPQAQRLFELTDVLGRLSFHGRAFANRITRRQGAATRRSSARLRPDFEVLLDLNLDAPRAARNYVRDLLRGDPSPELREAVMLLTSELVTPIVGSGVSVFLEAGELRVWLRGATVRVELKVPRELVLPPRRRRRAPLRPGARPARTPLVDRQWNARRVRVVRDRPTRGRGRPALEGLTTRPGRAARRWLALTPDGARAIGPATRRAAPVGPLSYSVHWRAEFFRLAMLISGRLASDHPRARGFDRERARLRRERARFEVAFDQRLAFGAGVACRSAARNRCRCCRVRWRSGVRHRSDPPRCPRCPQRCGCRER